MKEAKYTLPDGYCIKTITQMDKFYELRSSWDKLLESQTSHVPFLCFDWFRLWLEYFLGNDRLFVLLVFKNDDLDAIAPLVLRRQSYKGFPNCKRIELIGNIYSPIRNFIFRSPKVEDRKQALVMMLFFFKNCFKEWDLLELDAMPEEDNCYHILEQIIPDFGYRMRTFVSFVDWQENGINYSSKEYIKKLPKKVTNELGRRKRRLDEIGNVRLEIGTNGTNFKRHMDLYYEVRKKSWKSPENDWRFHCAVRKMAAENGWLRCGLLFLDDKPIAAQIRLVCQNIAYFMEALHDSDFNKFGPGHILRFEMIKHFIDSDAISQIDQVRGGESYKRYWLPNGEERYRRGFSIFNNNVRGLILSFLMTKILPRLRKYPTLLNAKKIFFKEFPADR